MRTRRRSRDIVWIALVAAALAVPAAVADNAGSASLRGKVNKALKTAKRANKRSKLALEEAQQPGPAGPQGDPGPPGPAGPGAIWALVKSDGTIVDQSGGISIASAAGSEFYVNFGQNIADRALVVSGAYLSGNTAAHTAITERCGGGTDLVDCVVPGTNNTNHAFVRTFNGDGVASAQAFYITAIQGE